MSPARHWTAEAIESMIDAQGLRLAPGRAAKIAAALNASADPSDPLPGRLELEADPTSYALVMDRQRSK